MTDIQRQAQAELIAEDFVQYLNEFHSFREPYDDELDADIHERYARAKRKKQYFDFKSQPHFSPSSANADDRELYEKIKKAKRDETDTPPFQRRWTALGTAMGDMLQREVLLAERHYKKFTGKEPRFKMARTEDGDPMFEDFVKTMKVIEHKGKRFSLHGTTDGIMVYVNDDGEVLRVGLEIKSKQTTYAQTSYSSMTEPKEDHVKQCVCYSLMYGVDYYIILYVNASKKGWFMSKEDFRKYPDIRAFGLYITEQMKQAVLDKFARVVQHVELGIPPKLDIDRWQFNNFKRYTALRLEEDEVAEIEETVNRIKRSRMPDWKKKQYVEMLDFIKEVRSENAEE
jgi:hypothetical protein